MKKGFTLMELLGVLVLLAILALVAAPITINLIKDAKQESDKRSMDNYIDAVNLAVANYNAKLSNEEINDTTCTIQSNGDLNCGETIIEVNIKKSPAVSGTIEIKDNEVSNYYNLVIGDKTYNSVTFNGTFVAANPDTDTHLGIVYLDPTDLSATCTAQDAAENLNDKNPATPTGINSGCMKFYVFKETSSDYVMILDHNTSGNVAYNSFGSNLTMLEVNSRLLEDTANWVGNPRLITLNEIIKIVGLDEAIEYESEDDVIWFVLDGSGDGFAGWEQVPAYVSTSGSRYAWLLEYLNDSRRLGGSVEDNNAYPTPTKTSETLAEIDGYWISTPKAGGSTEVWVEMGQLVYPDSPEYSDRYGVRPVITLSKYMILR